MSDTLDVIADTDLAALTWLPSGLDDTVITWITGVSRTLDVVLGPIVQRAVTDQIDGGREVVLLSKWPVASFTSVTEHSGSSSSVLSAESPGTISGDRYLPIDGGMLRRRNGGCDTCWATGRRNVVVVYSAGRYADTASVDARYKTAALMMLRNLITRELSGGTATFGGPEISFPGATYAVPRAVVEMFPDEVQNAPGLG